ncbi:unnamed protein product [Adineta ricciae]|uniref:Uncharacterized protein n=1 Tax=Adineta ricciae TaxID=249248 RepID=A0A813RNI8_ADIRI|nr:unnamed protein product [Adineta ricciae]
MEVNLVLLERFSYAKRSLVAGWKSIISVLNHSFRYIFYFSSSNNICIPANDSFNYNTRPDISVHDREGKAGIALRLSVYVTDANNCTPLVNTHSPQILYKGELVPKQKYVLFSFDSCTNSINSHTYTYMYKGNTCLSTLLSKQQHQLYTHQGQKIYLQTKRSSRIHARFRT